MARYRFALHLAEVLSPDALAEIATDLDAVLAIARHHALAAPRIGVPAEIAQLEDHVGQLLTRCGLPCTAIVPTPGSLLEAAGAAAAAIHRLEHVADVRTRRILRMHLNALRRSLGRLHGLLGLRAPMRPDAGI